jgi:hypothetical protein
MYQFRYVPRVDGSCRLRNFTPFYKAENPVEPDYWQYPALARGEIKRLIINVPPRSMKSITVTVGFTTWILGRDPTKRIIAVSYAEELARKLAIDTCSVMESDGIDSCFRPCNRDRRFSAATSL